MRRHGALAAALALLLPLAAPAEPSSPSSFRLVERSDFSRYLDGRYIGHVYREARGALSPLAGDGGYAGEFLVLEETLRDMRSAARRIDRAVPVRLELGRGGAIEVKEDSGYPSLRGLPALPEGDMVPGTKWIAPGSRALDFDDSGSFVILPFLAEYQYKGPIEYGGTKALAFSAKFATRWKPEITKAGDRPAADIIKGATGTHDLDIVVDRQSLAPLFIRDRFDETFVLAGGGAGGGAGASERRSGFSLFFFEGSAPLDRGPARGAIEAAIGGSTGGGPKGRDTAQPEALPPGAGPGPLIAGEASPLADGGGFPEGGALGAAGLELDTSPEGMVLRVRDLRFVADSDAILPSESWRLDAIAAALKALPSRSFMVAGHSAAVGKSAGELELSIQRAKRVTDELAARGVVASRLLYRGFGSSRPLAPNDTEEGRARNRRVEITILD